MEKMIQDLSFGEQQQQKKTLDFIEYTYSFCV